MPGQPSARRQADASRRPPAGIEVRELGHLLRQKRADEHLSIRQAAASANVSFSTLSRVEAGAQPDLATFVQLCAWLSVDPSDFLYPIPLGHRDLVKEVARHLTTDPNLSAEAAERIVMVVREMYGALSEQTNYSQRPPAITLHLRAASIMRPGVPERLASLLGDMHTALQSKARDPKARPRTVT